MHAQMASNPSRPLAEVLPVIEDELHCKVDDAFEWIEDTVSARAKSSFSF